MKLYLVVCETGDADQWEGGTEEADAVFATTDKAKLDDYLSTRMHGYQIGECCPPNGEVLFLCKKKPSLWENEGQSLLKCENELTKSL